MEDRLSVLLEMLENDPNDQFVLYAICLELFKIGRAEEAIERMQNLLKFSPDYTPAYFRLGQWYAEQDEIQKALEILNRGKEIALAENDQKAKNEIQELINYLEDYE